MTAIIKKVYPNIFQEIENLYHKMTLDTNNIIENVFKLIGGALGVKLFDYWIERYKERKNKIQTDVILANLKDISDMNVIMSDVVAKTSATRFLIFRGHDSGSVPNPKHPYYTKCLWQQTKDGSELNKLRNKYESIQVDVPYINMMIQVLVNGFTKLSLEKMEDSMLKNLYLDENIKYSEIYFLAQEKSNYIYYCSVATNVKNTDFSDKHERVEIDLAINKLRQIFKKI